MWRVHGCRYQIDFGPWAWAIGQRKSTAHFFSYVDRPNPCSFLLIDFSKLKIQLYAMSAFMVSLPRFKFWTSQIWAEQERDEDGAAREQRRRWCVCVVAAATMGVTPTPAGRWVSSSDSENTGSAAWCSGQEIDLDVEATPN